MTINPDKEFRRLETIYKTFLKMNLDERKRTLEFMNSRYRDDVNKLRRKQHEKEMAAIGKETF